MEILITDCGIYPHNSDAYYESFHIADLLSSKYDVDIFKDRILDIPQGKDIKSFDEIIHKKYEIIISLNPIDFSYIIKYIKLAKHKPSIIFIDRFSLTEKLYNHLKSPYTKILIKILKYMSFYFTTRKNETNMAQRFFSGLNIVYIPPYISNSHFAEKPNSDCDFPILFSSIIDNKYSDLKTLIKAIKYIANSDFAERNDFKIDVIGNGVDYEKFKRKIARNKISEYFVFNSGNDYSHIQPQLRIHLFSLVIPSNLAFLNETLSLMANGIPAIIDSDSNEFINDTINGLIFEKGNWRDLANKIMLMLATDTKEMKMNAISKAREIEASYDFKLLSAVDNVVNAVRQMKYDEEIDSKL